MVNAGDQGLTVSTWKLALHDADPEGVLADLERLPEIHVEGHGDTPDLSKDEVATLVFSEARKVRLRSEGTRPDASLRALHSLLAYLWEGGRTERTGATDFEALEDLSPDLACLIVFPPVTAHDLITQARAGRRLPAGVTRVMVSPRVLRANYPLEWLRSADSLEVKQRQLRHWLNSQLEDKRVRFYPEAVFLFDE
jgi:hypothetical protein